MLVSRPVNNKLCVGYRNKLNSKNGYIFVKYWRINTDKDARTDVKTYDLWYQHGMVFTGDYANNIEQHSSVLKKLNVGDGIFMHHSGTGIVGYGNVSEKWGKKIYQGEKRLLYVDELYEYRIKVNWLQEYDRRDNPLPIKDNLPYMSTYSNIDPEKWDISAVLDKLRRKDFIHSDNKTLETEKCISSLAEEAYYRENSENLKLIARRHNKLSNQFTKWLRDNDFSNVQQEQNYVDVCFQKNNNTFRAELKICHSVGTTKSIREALGQLFEYNYYLGRKPSDYWVIVLDEKPTKNDIEYLRILNKKLNLPLLLCWQFKSEFKFANGLEL